MTIRNLEKLLAPQSVALIGASTRPGSVGNTTAANLAAGAFRGQIGFVNPKGGERFGRPVARSLAALGWVPDLAVIASPPRTIPETIAELGHIGTRAALVMTAGVTGELRQQAFNAARPTACVSRAPTASASCCRRSASTRASYTARL